MFGGGGAQGDFVRAQFRVTPGEVLEVFSASGAVASGPPVAITSFVRVADNPTVQFVGIGGGVPSGDAPTGSRVFAPAVALQITAGDTDGGPAGVAGSGGPAGGNGADGYMTLYLGN